MNFSRIEIFVRLSCIVLVLVAMNGDPTSADPITVNPPPTTPCNTTGESELFYLKAF